MVIITIINITVFFSILALKYSLQYHSPFFKRLLIDISTNIATMSKLESLRTPIQEIVEATGLPSEFWPSVRPQLIPKLMGCNYQLSQDYQLGDFDFDTRYRDWIKVHEKTIATLQGLPAAQVLGHATLVRTPNQLTAMVSLAEAATVSMDENYCQLMWVMMQLIEKGLRSDGKGYCHYNWQQEISHMERLSRDMGRDMGRGMGRDFNEGLLQQLVEIKDEQQKIMHELGTVRRQNNDILRLLTATSQGSHEQGTATVVDAEVTTPSTAVKTPRKYYTPHSTQLGLRQKNGQWFLCSNKNVLQSKSFAVLIDWLEVQLGEGSLRASPSSRVLRWINLRDENKSHARSEIIAANYFKETGSCWRQKILGGNILELPIPEDVKGSSGLDLQKQGPFQDPRLSDCLVLTAAALWSLFDNSLERMPNCQCTFRAAGGDFIQCRSKQGGWFIWHTFSHESTCEGKNCDDNIRISLAAEEAGQRLHTTSPCALGWFAMGRHSADSTIWKRLSATAEFKQKTLVKYAVKEFQIQAQLSVPAVVHPQIGCAVTFSKQNYAIAYSIDHDSIIAMERAAAFVVLIYDESRRLHLTFDGADVIEMCCIHFLREIGCDRSHLPSFTHSSALLRLQTWLCSNFVSIRGTYFTGDQLVRQATRKISELIEITKRAFEEDTKLLYWLLEDVLRGCSGQALKAPRCQHASWHKLAFAAPPLILVVGELDAQLLTMSGTPLRWSASESKPTAIFKKVFGLTGIFDNSFAPGGIAGSQETVRRWFLQGHSYVQSSLIATMDKVIYGEQLTDVEHTHEVNKNHNGDKVSFDHVFANCTCTHTETQRCLHYIQ
jgi:hypothetical protein